MKKKLSMLFVGLLCSCASMNDAMTPSLRETTDDFYSAKVLTQPSVSAASGVGDSWNTLGFDWTSRLPGSVFVTVGTRGCRIIEEAGFNIDGRIIDSLPLASQITECDHGWGRRRFEMKLQDFEAMAGAQVVRMRVGRLNDALVSTFGTTVDTSTVGAKFIPFLARVRELRVSK